MYEYMCVCMHLSWRVLVRSIWNGLGYFWSPEERSRDGVWSQNRESSLLLGMGGRGEESGVGMRNSLLWMSCYSAGSLWLTVKVNVKSSRCLIHL